MLGHTKSEWEKSGMVPAIVQRIGVIVKQWLQRTAEKINHQAVIKDIVQDVDISAGYFLTLTLANLIALSGLITNSAPVIIGAMLISPLMGPILSIGFAFVTGDRQIWRRSVKKIALSVAVTIVVAAFASAISPLREITQEIVSRTRPNLYDLIIAFLAGSAGAAALCTKRNYLTIVPGVAIATAVIPPLSVAGFGAGIGNVNILLGGFFLFFTNFVAIIIATTVVFFIYGFRPRMVTDLDVTQLRKRIAYLAVVFIVISIPLIYTLHASIAEIHIRRVLSKQLQSAFDREKQSHLSTFNYAKKQDAIDVNVVINTIDYLNDADVAGAEKTISEALGQKVRLNVEQVKVQPGGLRKVEVQAPIPAIAPPRPPMEVIKASRENAISVVRQSSEKVDKIIAPSSIADFTVSFHDKTFTVSIAMKIRRDTPVSEEERAWIRRMIASELNLPVDLSVETVPFVPLLVFKRGETAISDDMKTGLLAVKEAFKKDPSVRCRVEVYPETGLTPQTRKSLSKRRILSVEEFLQKSCQVPPDRIESSIAARARREPMVRVLVLTGVGKE
jgi:uncharacterized hydrophobic protein (TIGR00271 family)